MRVKLVRAVGARPPEIGHWWHGEKMQVHANHVANGVREQKDPPNWDWERGYPDYASDLWNWKEKGKDYASWASEMFDTYPADTVWWGVVLETEPEVNEFGVVSP